MRGATNCTLSLPHPLLRSLLQTMLPSSGPVTPAGGEMWLTAARFAGYAVFWAGMSVGVTNLGSGCVDGMGRAGLGWARLSSAAAAPAVAMSA